MPDSETRSVLITGGARRIGAEISRALAADGWFVCIHCHASRDAADALLEEIRTAGGSGKVIVADLADPDAITPLAAAAAEDAPPLSALVNNASVFEYDTLDSVTPHALDEHFAVNLRAPVLLSQAFAQRFDAAAAPEAGGCIVNILDNKIFSVNPDYLSYTLAKFGLHGATLAMAMDLAPAIRVNAIAPGITLESGGQGEESFKRGQRMSPLGRVSSPEDIVAALRFILATRSLNGEVITIDGGQSLQRLPRDVAFMDPGMEPSMDRGED